MKLDLRGQKFGRYTVLRRAKGRSKWTCRCECGVEKAVLSSHLKSGHTTSCGCFQRENTSRVHKTHGLRGIPEYEVWGAMLARCTRRSSKDYKNYGGRGIRVPDAWKKFQNFIADMGHRPSAKHTLERKDNSLGYSAENCVWATRLEQNRNRRNVRRLTHDGKTLLLSEWAALLGITTRAMQRRVHYGLTKARLFHKGNVRHVW